LDSVGVWKREESLNLQPKIPTGAKPPFAPECCAKELLSTISICLSEQKSPCKFKLNFDNEVLCQHPLHKSIVARTVANAKVAKG